MKEVIFRINSSGPVGLKSVMITIQRNDNPSTRRSWKTVPPDTRCEVELREGEKMSTNQKLLEAAATPVLERIRRDGKNAPRQVKPLLTYLENHLFDPDLDANHLKRACGVRDNTLPIKFHRAVSLPPYAYIEDCRLEVACRLLTDTDLRVWQIAQLIGYSTLQVFSRAFDRWSGVRPTIYRSQSRRSREVLESVRPRRFRGTGESGNGHDRACEISLPTLRKAAIGALQRHEADELARCLSKLYPESFAPAARLSL